MQLSGIVKHYLRTSTNFTSITDAAHQYRLPCNSTPKRHVLWIRSFPKRALLYLRYVTEKETMSVSLNDELQCDNLYENKHTCKKPDRYKYAFVIRPSCLSTLVFEVDIPLFSPKSQARGKYFSSTVDVSQVNNVFKLLNFTEMLFQLYLQVDW